MRTISCHPTYVRNAESVDAMRLRHQTTLVILPLLTIFCFPVFAHEMDHRLEAVNLNAPSGCEDRGGGVIGSNLSKDRQLGWHRFDCKTTSIFWLQELINRSPLEWRVIDVLRIAYPHDGRSILLDQDGCGSLSETGFVIAVGKWIDGELGGYAKELNQAWIVSDKLTDTKNRD